MKYLVFISYAVILIIVSYAMFYLSLKDLQNEKNN